MCVQDTGPVIRLEVGLVVDINLDLDELSGLLDRVCGDTDGCEGATDQSSDTRWAPLSDNITSLEGELGSEDRVLDCAVIADLTEGEGLVDRGALVSEGVDGALGVDGDADGQTTGNTRGGTSRGGEILNRDARDVLNLGLELGHVQGCA